ncbi:class I SAM-dependent methyltransferase [Actinophytocola gossypii]|nr:class I SAM-dependent methyltransferase [Actinophytocola gossypii]
MTGGPDTVTDEDVAVEWVRRASRPGLRPVMRASQPDSLDAGVTELTRTVVGTQLGLVADRLGHRPRRTLEIGCGIGRLTPTLAQHSDRVHAIDMTPAMLDRARTACRHLSTVDFAQARLDRLPPPGERFDAAVCVWVLMHVLDEDQLAESCRRVAASTRYLTLVEYDHAHIPVSRWSRLRPLEHYLRLLPGAEVVDERTVEYGGDHSFAALIAFPEATR